MATLHQGGRPGTGAVRLTPATGALLVAAALALFFAAYSVGGFFGRAADDKQAGVVPVPAEAPSGDADVLLVAKNVAFDTESITVPADRPVVIRIDNIDAGILHNIAVYRDEQVSELVARGALFGGPEVRQYRFQPFPVGTYYFQCDLHPAMSGTFVAQ